MFAVGHLAAGYLTGKAASKILRVEANIPLLFVLSILPDIDLTIPGLVHRGPTHSVIVMAVVSLPFFIAYRKAIIPYLIAAIQHSLIGDLLVGGGIQLLWPLTTAWIGLQICQISIIDVLSEWIIFIISVATMLKLGDMRKLIEPHLLNLLLIAPVASIISPLLFRFPVLIPTSLYVPHLAYLVVLSFSIICDIKYLIKKPL